MFPIKRNILGSLNIRWLCLETVSRNRRIAAALREETSELSKQIPFPRSHLGDIPSYFHHEGSPLKGLIGDVHSERACR